MGLYCSVTVPVQRPYCGIVEARECQTKDLRGIYDFEAWKVGDNIIAPFRMSCTAVLDARSYRHAEGLRRSPMEIHGSMNAGSGSR